MVRSHRWFSRVQARINRWRQEIVPGRELAESIDIGRLICPLRYDLCVRIEFIRLLRDEWALYSEDLPAFLKTPVCRAYYIWFKEARCAYYFPELYPDEKLLQARFLDRMRKTAQLWSSIEQHGYDSSTPIRLESGRSIKRVNGKLVNSRYFAGDGCHRIACLYVTGRRRLEPADYEVSMHREFDPLDITVILIKHLPLDRRAYLHFVSPFYCDGQDLGSAEQIVRHVTAHRPDLVAEVESVLAFDLPISQI